MSDRDFDLDDAYAVETPEDNRRLYARWAESYDEGFLATHGYVYHESVVAALLDRRIPEAPVVDVGCGTGVVGEELRRRGIEIVDGVDLSPEMLAVAATKRTESGAPVYRHLLEADLTEGTGIDSETYGAVVSAGAFTHGHLGPEPLAELVRIAAPGAVLAIGVNENHYRSSGFEAWFDEAVASGLIVRFDVVESAIYDPARYTATQSADQANTKSMVAVFEAAG